MCACVRVTSLVRLVDLAVEQDGLEEPEHGGEEAHHLGLLDDRRRGVAQPGHGGEARDEICACRKCRSGQHGACEISACNHARARHRSTCDLHHGCSEELVIIPRAARVR